MFLSFNKVSLYRKIKTNPGRILHKESLTKVNCCGLASRKLQQVPYKAFWRGFASNLSEARS